MALEQEAAQQGPRSGRAQLGQRLSAQGRWVRLRWPSSGQRRPKPGPWSAPDPRPACWADL